MSELAIRVEHLGKKYRLGGQQARYATFRETLVNVARVPLGWLKGERRAEQNILWALDDVSFEVRHGEAVGIIGRNGAGKSTLLKILARITSPTRGRVDIFGRVGSLLEVGTGFHPELTGRENIFLNGAILGMTRREIDRKFDEIVDFAEIEKFLDTPVKFYSSGMYVRLAFAVAAHLEPEILVVDEVLAVGDAAFQKKCLGKMGDVAHEGRTVLFVSHQLDMIRALCERTILLNSGCILNYDTSDQVINAYLLMSRSQLSKAVFEGNNDNEISIQVIGARFCDIQRHTKQSFDVFEQICLEIEYVVRKSIIGAHVCFEIKNNGAILFWSFDTDNDEELIYDSRKLGIFQSFIRLPCPLLKPGHYQVSFYTGIANSERIQTLEEVISFDVELVSKGSTYLSYADKRPGMIAVSLNWDTEKISQMPDPNYATEF